MLDTLRVPTRYAEVFGERMAYYEGGSRSAPTLILLPNLGWDSHSWAQNFSVLAQRYHVVAVDPVGLGRSSKPLIDYKMDTWTDFLDEFMRVKNIARAFFVGTVMGGALSVQMALDHPERVLGIVVAASNTGPGPHEGGRAIPSAPSLAGTRANLLALFFDSTLVTDTFVRERFRFRLKTNDGYTIQRHLADHRAPYSRDELARIQVPALVVWCREDRITPISWGEQYAAALPRGQLATLESCGHLPNLEQPQAFNRAVLEFLRLTSRTGVRSNKALQQTAQTR
ncbi:MAG: alpha/beta fold hydrolase [Gemmatimonadaceae bacterium]